MRIDHIMYKRSTLSVPKGYLQVLPDNTVSFTKYKDQLEGRMNILLWLVYNIVMSFMQDKELVNLKKEDIKAVNYTANKVGMSFGGKYGELLIKANDGTAYEFLVDPDYDQEKIAAFVEAAK